MHELRRIVLVAVCVSAFIGVTAPAYASDASLEQAYNSTTARFAREFRAENRAELLLVRSHLSRSRPVLKAIDRLRVTGRLTRRLTLAESPSSGEGARAKALLVSGLDDLDLSLVALQRSIRALVHGHRVLARKQFLRFQKLFRRGSNREREGLTALANAINSAPATNPSPPPGQQPPPQSSPPPSQPPSQSLLPGILPGFALP
ncbi:MAG: hypothetical protein QOK04_904 [Solirubrobacteraceae bacterium]|nr:hypothetical protein [Solirubrobacteraceae bacterium]